MQIKKDINTVIFDCDGVLFDSNLTKTKCFEEVLKNESAETIKLFIKYHCENGGVSRHQKFIWFYRDILQVNNWLNLSEKAAERFGRLVNDAFNYIDIIPGTIKLLDDLQLSGIDCHVISGGDEIEVKMLLKKKKIDRYFQQILGSPKTKNEHLKKLTSDGVLKQKVIFIGDALTDLVAAESYGFDFIFVSGYTLWKEGEDVCRSKGWKVINDLNELICES